MFRLKKERKLSHKNDLQVSFFDRAIRFGSLMLFLSLALRNV